MTKKLFLALLTSFFILLNAAYAERVKIDDLQVNLMNLGSENCILTKQRFFNGALFESQLPLALPANGERYYFTVTGTGNINVELTYQCGDSKKATLQILQYHKAGHKHTSTEFHLLNEVDIFESHEIYETESSYCHRECSFENGHKYPGKLGVRLTHL